MARKKIEFDKTIDFTSEEFRKERYEKKLAKYKDNLKKRKEVTPENHSCIPPKVKQNGPGEGLAKYDLFRNNRDYIGRRLNSEKSLKETYPNKSKGKPWYFLKPWESATINSKHESVKRTKLQAVIDLCEHKIDKWKKIHPEPIEKVTDKSDLFYKQSHSEYLKEMTDWIALYEEMHPNKVAKFASQYYEQLGKPLIDYVNSSHHKYKNPYLDVRQAA